MEKPLRGDWRLETRDLKLYYRRSVFNVSGAHAPTGESNPESVRYGNLPSS